MLLVLKKVRILIREVEKVTHKCMRKMVSIF
jgi:hypothetical protein